MSFIEIDLENYPRRRHFEHFLSTQYPYVGVTVDVDVTQVVQFCKEKGLSFYIVFMHAVALAADEIPEFRRRIKNGKIIEYNECPTSHIELLENETYCYCTLRHHMKFEEYISYAEKTRTQCRLIGSIEEDDENESTYFISTLPWINYTALIQPVAGGEDSNPRITWGKFQADASGRLQMPVTVLAHHGLVDGLHIARFYENLKKRLEELTK